MKNRINKTRSHNKNKILKKTKRDKFLLYIFIAIFLISLLIYFIPINSNSTAILETNYGTIEIELYTDMPITTGNFKQLIENGIYDGVIFHRIISGFMIQGGDPTGTGFGDRSIPSIKDEFTHKGGNRNDYGTISMANSGPNTGSSQFFINTNKEGNNFLDTKHPAFGKVINGMDVVSVIEGVQTGAQDRPVENVVILKASLK